MKYDIIFPNKHGHHVSGAYSISNYETSPVSKGDCMSFDAQKIEWLLGKLFQVVCIGHGATPTVYLEEV